MKCEVEYTDEFGEWWEQLDEKQQTDVAVSVSLLERKGLALPFPHSSAVFGSKYKHMRELRTQSAGGQATANIICVRPKANGDSPDRRRKNRR
jgi:hypothetical protein